MQPPQRGVGLDGAGPCMSVRCSRFKVAGCRPERTLIGCSDPISAATLPVFSSRFSVAKGGSSTGGFTEPKRTNKITMISFEKTLAKPRFGRKVSRTMMVVPGDATAGT